MRFLVNANFGAAMIQAIQEVGFEAVSVPTLFGSGYPDSAILEYAAENEYIIVTKDSDFGELVFRQNRPHSGIIYIREEDDPVAVGLIQEFLRAKNDPRGRFVRLKR